MIKKVTITIILLVSTVQIFACDCYPLPTIENAYNESEYVLKVKVISVKLKHQLDQTKDYLDSLGKKEKHLYFGPNWSNEYLLIVDKEFKGQIKSDTIVLRTALYPSSDCGLILEKDKTYLLYGYLVKPFTDYFQFNDKYPILTSNACTRTTLANISEEKELIKLRDSYR